MFVVLCFIYSLRCLEVFSKIGVNCLEFLEKVLSGWVRGPVVVRRSNFQGASWMISVIGVEWGSLGRGVLRIVVCKFRKG
jgi:hypothetical protein